MVVKKNNAVISRKEENGDYFLFNTLNGQFKRLNVVGGVIWNEIEDEIDFETLCDNVVVKFVNGNKEQISNDILRFLNELKERDLVSIE